MELLSQMEIPTGPQSDYEPARKAEIEAAVEETKDYIQERLNEQNGQNGVYPWSSGTFQNRSVAANTYTQLTPVFQSGIDTIIAGNRFVASVDGLYSLSFSVGNVSSSGVHGCLILKNNDAESAATVMRCFFNGAQGSINALTCGVSYTGWLNAGEFFSACVWSSSTQSTIAAQNITPQFSFGKIR